MLETANIQYNKIYRKYATVGFQPHAYAQFQVDQLCLFENSSTSTIVLRGLYPRVLHPSTLLAAIIA
jgi:hypothetical protein